MELVFVLRHLAMLTAFTMIHLRIHANSVHCPVIPALQTHFTGVLYAKLASIGIKTLMIFWVHASNVMHTANLVGVLVKINVQKRT
jgi:hypothetical protein